MKKKTAFIIIIIILFLNVFLDVIPINYTKKYKIKDYKIVETYNKKDNIYSFDIAYNNDTFNVLINDKYQVKKKIIKSIKKIKINDGYCLELKSNKLDLYPVCKQDNKYISFHLIPELKKKISSKYYKEYKKINDNYDTIDINYLNNNKYLIWNYRYFYYLNKNDYKKIHLFDNDYYQIELATQVNDYLFIPDYDDGYSFNKAYVINMKNGSLKEWDLKYEISSQSRILGTYNKSLYLLDEKNETLYEIVPHKMRMRTTSGKILENGKFKKYSIKTIINNNLSFKDNNKYKYVISDEKLYQVYGNNKVLLSKSVSSIIRSNNDTVYYLSSDDLYMYNPYYGNVLLITNFEWSFNNDNVIFIY